MKKIIAIVLAMSLVILQASSVVAAPQVITLTLDQAQPVVEDSVTFTLTRTVAGPQRNGDGHGDAQNRVLWVRVECYDGPTELNYLELPIVWGTETSLVGTAGSFPVQGDWCEAFVSEFTYKNRPPIVEIYFTVAN